MSVSSHDPDSRGVSFPFGRITASVTGLVSVVLFRPCSLDIQHGDGRYPLSVPVMPGRSSLGIARRRSRSDYLKEQDSHYRRKEPLAQ